MAALRRIRELLRGPLDPEYLRQRESEGWRLLAVEWERKAEGEVPEPGELAEEVPFGLRVAADCTRLEEDPTEKQALLLMMELIVQDLPLSRVAQELNRQGFRTRQGANWDPVSVFYMLPRLIEVGPRIFTSEEWVARRQHLFKLR